MAISAACNRGTDDTVVSCSLVALFCVEVGLVTMIVGIDCGCSCIGALNEFFGDALRFVVDAEVVEPLD
jgi:hypothetical protein